ncbi:MAG: hypothetical protein F8N37_12015 [Telmatospirillum sp.]|nr:hypothetical protein [Telmatospirillum sp.]
MTLRPKDFEPKPDLPHEVSTGRWFIGGVIVAALLVAGNLFFRQIAGPSFALGFGCGMFFLGIFIRLKYGRWI